MTTRVKFILGSLFFILLAGGAYVYFQKQKEKQPPLAVETSGGNDGATITVTKIEPPSLTRPIVIPEGTDPNVAAQTRAYWENLIAELQKNPYVFINWVDLGLQRFVAKDYEGAREAWEYANALAPENSVAYGNLGNLYGYYLKDPKKAEENFLSALKNGPAQTYLYFQTADFYVQVLKSKKKAVFVVEEGLAKNPGNPELQALKKQLQAS